MSIGSQLPRVVHGAPSKPVSSGSRQVPPRQTRSPEQSVGVPPGPAQQGLSISPHAVDGSAFTHSPVVTSHASEPTHAVDPSQQGWPSSPHEPHVPSWQTSPDRHTNPGQHVPPAPPQPEDSGGRSVSGFTHAPSLQTSPTQQSADPVHAAVRGAQHCPPSHERPRQQSPVESQRAPPPAWMQHTSPPPQRKPSSQMRPTQQPAPEPPQGPLGVTLPSGPTTEPSMPVPPSWCVGGLVAHPGATTSAAKKKERSKLLPNRMSPMLPARCALLQSRAPSRSRADPERRRDEEARA